MEVEKQNIAKMKEEGKDTTDLEANSLDEQARRYFRRMVRTPRLSIYILLSIYSRGLCCY